jgi:hypothetical protein
VQKHEQIVTQSHPITQRQCEKSGLAAHFTHIHGLHRNFAAPPAATLRRELKKA